ncbi:uncharacterized protein PAC_00021 [Phialocephala subalpina]|uniref:Heterokaryon incompatibility domain-containing protein n=1 Tax=Phialocephala subalpina TaxID=576137 RepID=A0A1L7WBV9_9HELO|nr:uncharacterized protein PAC_00021 [Phialocephala subalpina]
MAISYKIGGGSRAEDRSVGISLERRGTGWGVFFNAGEHEEWRLAMNFLPAKQLNHDDAKDWEREAVKMSAVYDCAEVTIAASSSEDGSKGLFYERQLPFQQLCLLHITKSEQIQTLDVVLFEHWNVSLARLVLSTRAWAYQERRLSPRVIFFTSTHLAWQCKTWGGKKWKTEGVGKVSRFFNLQNQPEAEDFWDETVKEYSASKLTFWSDKLTGISGVARRRQNAVGGEYVAGMWREDLESQLCWLTASRSLRPPAQYMAPSWSWASTAHGIQTAVKYKDIENALVAKVLGVDTSLASDNPMGEVRKGVLKLQCRGLFSGIVGGQTPTLAKFGNCFMRRVSFFDYLETDRWPCYYLPTRKDDRGGFEGLVIKPTYQGKGGKKRKVKGDVDARAWDHVEFSNTDRDLLLKRDPLVSFPIETPSTLEEPGQVIRSNETADMESEDNSSTNTSVIYRLFLNGDEVFLHHPGSLMITTALSSPAFERCCMTLSICVASTTVVLGRSFAMTSEYISSKNGCFSSDMRRTALPVDDPDVATSPVGTPNAQDDVDSIFIPFSLLFSTKPFGVFAAGVLFEPGHLLLPILRRIWRVIDS